MQDFYNVDMTEVIPKNFLTLTVSLNTINTYEIKTKYPAEIAEKLISLNETLSPIINENSNRFAIQGNHNYYITKNKDTATASVAIDNTSESHVKIIKELKDPNLTHKYTAKKCLTEINKRLNKLEIGINFNSFHFDLFCKYYKIKENEKLCYVTKMFSQPQYSYSLQAIDFIVDEIKKDPDNIIVNLKEKVKKK